MLRNLFQKLCHSTPPSRRPRTRGRTAGRARLRFEPLEERALLAAVVFGDFNGDTFADMAVGLPNRDFGGTTDDVGLVHVVYGSANGLDESHQQVWYQGAFDGSSATFLADVHESGDEFGAALAVGDFNGDGFTDLAIGAPGENGDAGQVHVIYGSPDGLQAKVADYVEGQDFIQVLLNQRFRPGLEGILGSSSPGDRFGATLAAGDFNADGYEDLAIGSPHSSKYESQAGQVHVIYGSLMGLAADAGPGNQVWYLESVGQWSSNYARFGKALAAGDFNGDSVADLAIGSPWAQHWHDNEVQWSAGLVSVIYGSSGAGLSTRSTPPQIFHLGKDGASEAGDFDQYHFGNTLAAGDFNADGYDDLAVGTEAINDSSGHESGLVHVFYGGALGPAATNGPGTQLWLQSPAAGYKSHFADALAAADLDGNGADDLVIAAPFGNVLEIVYGIPVPTAGLGAGGRTAGIPIRQVWHRDIDGIKGAKYSASGEGPFGLAVALGDVDQNGSADLAAFSHGSSSYKVNVIYSSDVPGQGPAAYPTGAPANDLWYEDGWMLKESKAIAEALGSLFGSIVASAQFDAQSNTLGGDDLAPARRLNTAALTGALAASASCTIGPVSSSPVKRGASGRPLSPEAVDLVFSAAELAGRVQPGPAKLTSRATR